MELLTVNWTNTFVVVGFGFGMVLTILTLLVLLLIAFRNVVGFLSGRLATRKTVVRQDTDIPSHRATSASGTVAAISMALHQYTTEVHDTESFILTITHSNRPHSPWKALGIQRPK